MAGSAGPGDDVIFPLTGITLMDDLAAYRLARLVHGGTAAGQQWMPLGQRLPLGQQAIGTAGWQPLVLIYLVHGDLQTVRLFLEAVVVVGALAAFGVEQVAGHVGEHQFISIGIDQLVEAALAAAVAQRLPLGHGHLLQGLFLPKRSWLYFLDLLHGGAH